MPNILSDVITSKINKKIISGEYPIGEKIPNEQDIAKELKVSRNTVREAIKILISRNILAIKRGTGTFVSESPGLIDDPFGFYFMEKDKMIDYIFEIRRALEPEIVDLVVQRASDEEIAELVKIGDKIRIKLDKPTRKKSRKSDDSSLEISMQFHGTLARLSHNPILERMMPIIYNYLTEIHSKEKFENYRGAAASSHLEISLAIKNRDAAKARQLLIKHMEIPKAAFLKG